MQRTFNSKFLMHRITFLSQFFFRKKDISVGHLDLDIINHFQKQKTHPNKNQVNRSMKKKDVNHAVKRSFG